MTKISAPNFLQFCRYRQWADHMFGTISQAGGLLRAAGLDGELLRAMILANLPLHLFQAFGPL